MAKKHYSRRTFHTVATFGATLSLGLLSLAGFYALMPFMVPVVAAFGLSMLYEGEIYHANIGSALKKIFDREHYLMLTANDVLEELLKKLSHESDVTLCQFLIDYKAQKAYVSKLKHIKKRTKEQELLLKDAEKSLSTMQQFFMKTLFSESSERKTDYQKALHQQIITNEFKPDELKEKSEKTRHKILRIGLPAAMIVGGLFGFGSLYLACDAFGVLTFLTISSAAMPWLVIPLAALAGIGYIGLTFNSLSDMVWNDSVRNWYKELREECDRGINAATVTLVISSVLLVAVAISLTIFTGGTWWTLAKNTNGVLPFMLKIPKYITGIVVPIFTSIAQLIFSVENIIETFSNLKSTIIKKLGKLTWQSFKESIRNLKWSSVRNFFVAIPVALLVAPLRNLGRNLYKTWQQENIVQFLNPFRLAWKLVKAPIRIVGFIGHVISIGATSDQVPGVPNFLSAFISALSETFEDMHYFFDLSSHDHGHNHHADEHHGCSSKDSHAHEKGGKHGEHHHDDDEHEHCCNHTHDIPTQFYNGVLLLFSAPAAVWHWAASQLSRFSLFNKGNTLSTLSSPISAHDNLTGKDKIAEVDSPTLETSSDWHKAYTLMTLKEKEQELPEQSPKRQALHTFIDGVEQTKATELTATSFHDKYHAQTTSAKPGLSTATIMAMHRHKLHGCGAKTDSEQVFEHLQRTLSSAASCA